MEQYIKHLPQSTAISLAEQVDYLPGQIVSKTLSQNRAVSLTLFAFDKGEEISSHESGGDAMVTALDGTGEITINGEKFTLNAGNTIIMPAGIPHAVYGAERFKMLLTVIFPTK